LLLKIVSMPDYIEVFKDFHEEFVDCSTAFIEQFNEDNLKNFIESNLDNLKFALHIIKYFELPTKDRIFGNDIDVVIATYNANPKEFVSEALDTPINSQTEEDSRSYEVAHNSSFKRSGATVNHSRW